MEVQNMGANTQGENNAENVQNDEGTKGTQNAGQGEKLFTQDDVNRIVGERLARAKSTQASLDTSGRERELEQREMRLDARERLADLGISKDLLPLVNCTSKKTMEESISLIAGQFRTRSSANLGYRISTGVSSSGSGSGQSKGLSDNEIRSAMGLKER